MRLVVVVTVVGLVATAGAGIYLSTKPSEEQKFVASCEEVLKDRLKAPATYSLASATPMHRSAATVEQYMGWEVAEKRRQDEQTMIQNMDVWKNQDEKKKSFREGEWDRVSVWLEYDAANSYGTPIRDLAECSYVLRAGEDFLAPPVPFTTVNGFTPLEWSTHQLWKLNQSQ